MRLIIAQTFAVILISLHGVHASAETRHSPIVGGDLVTEPAVLNAMVDFGCSGFMIAPHYMITAHHCASAIGSDWKVSVGTQKALHCEVLSVNSPPDAKDDFSRGDFVLAKINCPDLNLAQMRYFQLPEPDENFSGAVEIAGFGQTCDQCSHSEDARWIGARLTTDYDMMESQDASPENDGAFFDSARGGKNVCMTVQKGHTPYRGDSGGPIYARSAQGLKIVSVVSVGIMTDKNNSSESAIGVCGPKISAYAYWILQTIH